MNYEFIGSHISSSNCHIDVAIVYVESFCMQYYNKLVLKCKKCQSFDSINRKDFHFQCCTINFLCTNAMYGIQVSTSYESWH